jgi:TolB-like protein
VALFDNETDVPEYDRLAQSLTDATVARLANDPGRVAVIGNAAILREPRPLRNITTIGQALGVDHVILGQVQQIGGQLRITTHLIRVGDQAHLWARRFEPATAETSSLDRTVSDAVAQAVAGRLLGGA